MTMSKNNTNITWWNADLGGDHHPPDCEFLQFGMLLRVESTKREG